MIIDTSALVGIAYREPGHQDLLDAMSRNAKRLRISAATYIEAGIVLDRTRDPVVSRRLDELLEVRQIEVVPVTASQARLARAAYRDYGRGQGHPAKLNYGDTFAYALAIENGEPLLFIGDDFVHTDVHPAI